MTHAVLVTHDGLTAPRTLCGRPHWHAIARWSGNTLPYWSAVHLGCRTCEQAARGRRLRNWSGTIRAAASA